MIARPFAQLPPETQPRTWLGANYWSRAGGPLMWRSLDADVVRGELRVLREHGLDVTRSFCYLPDFMPAPDTVDERILDRFAAFLDLSAEVGVSTIPTFIVGHMSGENWDVPWRQGRDLYADGWMLAQQAFFVRTVAARFRDHPAVDGWLLSNEMPLYGGATAPEYGRSWAELLVQAVRAGGARQPVSTGDGAWGIEVTGVDNGFRLRDLVRSLDFVGPHVYPMGDDVVRQHLTAAFTCELCHFGPPVILEEFGVTTDFASEAHAADYYRQVLHTSLLAGAVGWIAWNNTDFGLVGQPPYRHHPFELHFGLTHVDGTPKAPLREMAGFRQILDALDLPRCRRAPTETALLVPSYMDTVYPFHPDEERQAIRRNLLQAYVAAREADLAPALAREADGVPEARLLLVPCGRQLTGPTWQALEAKAEGGATVYVSYFAGDAPVQRGPWHPNFGEFFGVEHQLRYGLVNPIEDDEIVWTFVESFGDIAAGEELRFFAAGNASGRAYLPLVPTSARVVATDGRGRPALVEREIGNGRIVLAAYPLEYLAAMRPSANPEDAARLYQALAAEAGATPRIRVPRSDVLTDMLVRDDGTCFVWLISESEQEVAVNPIVADGASLANLATGEPVVGAIELAPYGVGVYRAGGNHS